MKKFFSVAIIMAMALVFFVGQAGAVANLFYTVKKGDTLWSVKEKTGYTIGQLLNMNTWITNPDEIFPGQRINLMPTSTGGGERTIRDGDEQIILTLMQSTTQKDDCFNEWGYKRTEKLMDSYLNNMGEDRVRVSCLYIENYAKRVMRLANALRSLYAKKNQCPSCCHFNENSLVVQVLRDKLLLILGATFDKHLSKSMSSKVKEELRLNVGQRDVFEHTYSLMIYHE